MCIALDGRIGVIMEGPVASGKGSQARLLIDAFGKVQDSAHVSTGELFRQRMKSDIVFFENFGDVISSGGRVPDQVVFETIKGVLPEISQKKLIILDGTVRSKKQAEFLSSFFSNPHLLICFSIKISLDEALSRVQQRAEIENRIDDLDCEKTRSRYIDWEKNKTLIHKKMRAKGVKIVEVDGNRTKSQVHQTILRHYSKHVSMLEEVWRRQSPVISKKKIPNTQHNLVSHLFQNKQS